MKGALYFEFSNKRALVFGAGKVGLRRSETLAGYGCFVTCVAPEIEEMSRDGITFCPDVYHEAALEGADFAVAATSDPALNQKILADCRARGILCNVTDDPEHSDFIFPAVLSRGDLDIAVTTKGASPMLTKEIIKTLSVQYDESYAERTALLKTLRQWLIETCKDPDVKRRELKAYKEMTIEELKNEVEKSCEL